jgi:hypothetical protein
VLRGGGGTRAQALAYRERCGSGPSGTPRQHHDAQLTLQFLLDERGREFLLGRASAG